MSPIIPISEACRSTKVSHHAGCDGCDGCVCHQEPNEENLLGRQNLDRFARMNGYAGIQDFDDAVRSERAARELREAQRRTHAPMNTRRSGRT